MSNEKIGQRAADDFRQEFNLGVGPIANIARLIEQTVGIGVAYVEAPAPGHGMTMRLGDRYMMAVACTPYPMRLRSTLAHELGHVRLDSVDRYLEHGEWDKRTPEEKQADTFARHLLVPLAAVREATRGTDPTLATLSDLVQRYQASPNIVAIQLREAGAIDSQTCKEWASLTSPPLASRFGWHAEYQALVAQSSTPRAPQALLARAVEGYRWNLVAPAVVARLEGKRHPDEVVRELAEDGITPLSSVDTTASRPPESGDALTPDEIARLMGETD